MLAQAILLAACGTRSIQVTASCEEEVPPKCVCPQHTNAPICVGDDWFCPPCISEEVEAGVPDTHPEMPRDADPTPPPDAGEPPDAGAGCGDGAALVCRRGCGTRVHEWKPSCDGTTWYCRWDGVLEERATPVRGCD